MGTALNDLLGEIRACTVCADSLEAGPRPIVQASPTARLVIIGQAPGRKVHESGIPWDDPSGRTLRAWLGVTEEPPHLYTLNAAGTLRDLGVGPLAHRMQ